MSDDRGRRPNWCTREAMYFDPKPIPLRSLKDIFEYLAKNDVEVPPEIMVEWCPLKTDVMVESPMVACSFIPRSWRWG